MSLRLDPRSGAIVLTMPLRGVLEKSARRFVAENQLWIEKQIKNRPPVTSVQEGMSLSLLGKNYVLVHKPGRGVTRFEGNAIIIHGRPEHLPRRLRDFLKKFALSILTERAKMKAAQIGKPLRHVRVVDPATRWGSCSPDGRLMFSWRIVFAPEDVMDYLVAHEVAHLAHMNHGAKFWALCFSLCDQGAASQRWLKRHGRDVMAYAL